MKRNGLLFGPSVDDLPNFQLVDTENKPTTLVDFTISVDGMEAPWGMARFDFMYDSKSLPEPPRPVAEILAWAKSNPGRFAYPQPPDFISSRFLKQVLVDLAEDPAVFQRPVPEQAAFDAVTAPLWDYLDALKPHLWRAGRTSPKSGPAARHLLADSEIDIAVTFHPADASNAIASGQLPDSVRWFVLSSGTIGNTHFLAIPFNASAAEGSMVLANFLLSAEAQAKKQDPGIWGDPTVPAVDRLAGADRDLFNSLPRGIATFAPEELGATLPEPHPSWMTQIEERWLTRYGKGQQRTEIEPVLRLLPRLTVAIVPAPRLRLSPYAWF